MGGQAEIAPKWTPSTRRVEEEEIGRVKVFGLVALNNHGDTQRGEEVGNVVVVDLDRTQSEYREDAKDKGPTNERSNVMATVRQILAREVYEFRKQSTARWRTTEPARSCRRPR